MVPRCRPLQQPLRVVAAPAAREHSCAAVSVLCRHGLRWHGGDCGLAGGSGTRVTAGGGQAGPGLCRVCIYTCWEQRNPARSSACCAREGETLMSSMLSAPVGDVSPSTYPEGGSLASRFLLCFCNGETPDHVCWPGGCAGTPSQALLELWPSCPCWQPRKGAWHGRVLSCQPLPTAARPTCGSCGMEQARGLHLNPPGRECSLWVSPWCPDPAETHCISQDIL